MKTFKYRIYPTAEQEQIMNGTLDICRNLYNSALLDRQRYYQTTKKGLTLTKQESQLAKDKIKYPELKTVHSQVLQDVIIRVKKAYQGFFRRIKESRNGKHVKPGYPKLKFNEEYKSFTYSQHKFVKDKDTNQQSIAYGFRIVDRQTLFLPKIGNITIKLHRAVKGNIKTCTIKKEVDGWYTCISSDVPAKEVKLDLSKPIGLDAGLTDLLTDSNGRSYENPRILVKLEKKLVREQRSLSRRKEGGKNYQKQAEKIAKLHKRIADIRRDNHHKISHTIVKENTFIAGDGINIRNMVHNNRLAKHIHDAGWGQLLDFVSYKAQEAGKTYIEPPAQNSTQECFFCGSETLKSLADRVHICQYSDCGITLPRDQNSALVALKRALHTVGTTGIDVWGELASTLKNSLGASRFAEPEKVLSAHHP